VPQLRLAWYVIGVFAEHHWLTWTLLAGSAFLGGGVNAIAGGGTLLTFPALIFTGVPPLAANATSTVALWPGSVASAWGYRSAWRSGPSVAPLLAVSLIGGLVGAVLALLTPATVFAKVVPFLVAFAALLFTVGDRLRAAIERGGHFPAWGVVAAQLPVAIYGGYLGGGIGLLMLAALTLLGGRDLHQLNALKSVLGLAINLTATIVFIASGLIDWPKAVAMAVAAALGGYLTARFALGFDVRLVKRAVIALGWLVTVALFVKTFG
jgi:hypothetical protein